MRKRIYIFIFILFLIFIFLKYEYKNFAISPKIYRTKFLWQVLDSETPLKDATILAKLGIQDYKVTNYLYDISGGKFYEYIPFDLNYDKHNKSIEIKRIYLQGVGTEQDTCWKYLEKITIPISFIKNNELSFDNINNKPICIDDYDKNNAISLYLDINNKGYLIKKELKGTTLQKKDFLGNILINFYYDKNLLIYKNSQTGQNLYVEKQKDKETYRDKKGNIIQIYEAITSYSSKYNRNIIQKIHVKNNKGYLIETIIFEYD